MGNVFKPGDKIVCTKKEFLSNLEIGKVYIVLQYMSINYLTLGDEWWNEYHQKNFISLDDYLLMVRKEKIKKLKHNIKNNNFFRFLYR